MSRTDDGRVIGNVLRLMERIVEERPRPDIHIQAAQPRRRFFCERMCVHVTACRMTDCHLFGKCQQQGAT